MKAPSPDTEPPLPNLSVQQLTYLVAATRAPSWALAAHSLGVTPSALSQGLAELERRVGVPLFERRGRRRLLHPQAAEVLAYAERVVAQTRDLARWLAARRGGRAGRLRVGMIDAAAIHHYPDVLAAFRADRPDLDLLLAVAPSGTLLDQLRQGELDLAVCVAPEPPATGLHVVPLREEPLAVYAPGGRRAGDPSGWGPWVTYPPDAHTRALVADSLRAAGARFDVVAESHQPEVLREMVRLGLGWAVLPVSQAEQEPHPLRRARREPIAVRHLVAVRRSEGPADPGADALLEALTAAA
ncbi:MAG: LysR family transcriptional regulator [Acidimicrobiales bacterium]|nr:LysR family transcriptional regulator [Acidimicrobiales bacterium]